MLIDCPICGRAIESEAWTCIHCRAEKGYFNSDSGPTGVFRTLLWGGQMGAIGGVFLTLALMFHKGWLWAASALFLLALVSAAYVLIRGAEWYPYQESWETARLMRWLPWTWFRNDDD